MKGCSVERRTKTTRIYLTEDESQKDSNKDQDSDVSFQEEADDEVDATDKWKNGSNSSNEVQKQKNT